MSLVRIKIENYKSIKQCDIDVTLLNLLIGRNGAGKTNILDAVSYFYDNITDNSVREDIYDVNNKFSNCVKITLYYDLTEFVKIAKANTDSRIGLFDVVEDIKYEGYYKSIMALQAMSVNNILSLELTQIKNKGISWNRSYENRFIIKSLFPFFCVNTRNLDITEWSYVWDILGELAKVSNHERGVLEKSVSELVEGNSEISKKIKGITTIFEKANVSIKPATPKEFAKALAKIYFSGETIFQKDKQLEYFSTGTNSVKYIELLLQAINELSETKLKEPIVLFDEPEISLHPNYIDELSESITDINPKTSIIISTHSSRLIKNILIQAEHVYLYNIKLNNSYTDINKMKKFLQYSPISRYRVDDNHVNSYFSESILFVEGESELELFANPYLKILFPHLKKVDIFKALTQQPELNIMHPTKTNSNIPYLCLIDMDKVFSFNAGDNQIYFKYEYLPKDYNREKLLFRNKKQKNYIYHQRQRINGMEKYLRVHYFQPYYSCSDRNYIDFIDNIQRYLLNYNIYPFKTTVEGALVTATSYEYALEFLEKRNSPIAFSEYNEYLQTLLNTDKLNLIRMTYKGKSDLLKEYKYIVEAIDRDTKAILDKVTVGKKGSGWVSDFIDGFFQKVSGLEKLTPKVFEKYIENNSCKKTIIKEFNKNFPEIAFIIKKVMV